jgi:hypothetical protein
MRRCQRSAVTDSAASHCICIWYLQQHATSCRERTAHICSRQLLQSISPKQRAVGPWALTWRALPTQRSCVPICGPAQAAAGWKRPDRCAGWEVLPHCAQLAVPSAAAASVGLPFCCVGRRRACNELANSRVSAVDAGPIKAAATTETGKGA